MSYLIDKVQVWNGTGTPPESQMSVEVRNDRIHWVGPASEWQGRRERIRVIDGAARTLIPGLMDCHVHYSSPGGPEWIARFTDPVAEISMRAVELAEISLRSGVTTARDVGAPNGVSINLANRARSWEILAPNIHPAGTWIAHRGTYVPFARQFGDADELREAIKVEISSGAELIKVALAAWNEGSRPEGASDIPFSQELLKVAVEEAHRSGFKIACHANDAASCYIAAQAGVDSLEHGMFLEPEDIEIMARNGTFLVPTMSVWNAMMYYARTVEWPEGRKRRAEAFRAGSYRVVAAAFRAGVKIALGTDAGGGAARHGRIAREAELMVEAGMQPSNALISGTSNAAKLMGETERGTIEKGKIADLVLLDENPLENINALRLVAAVIKSGRIVTPVA